jgi:hypothetical protein
MTATARNPLAVLMALALFRCVGTVNEGTAPDVGHSSPDAGTSDAGRVLTGPSVPAHLVANPASDTEIDLSWTASNGLASIAGYHVFQDGAQVATIPATSFQALGLAPSSLHSFSVSAYDVAGQTSAQTPAVSATTLAAPTSDGGLPRTSGWYQIPNTAIAPLCPTGPAGVCNAVIAAWNSGVADTRRNRLVFTGGGHSDYSGNEVYALDLVNLQMLRLTSPDPLVSCSEAGPAGNPNSRHTYWGVSYVASADKMYMHGGDLYATNTGTCTSVATWLFDFASLSWARQDPVNGTPTTQDCCNYITASAYDPGTDSVYYVDDAYLWGYKAQTNTQTQLHYTYGLDYHLNAVVDPGRELFLVFGGGQVWQADLTASVPSLSDIASQTTGCDVLRNTPYPGLAYDTVQRAIVGWVGGSSVIVYDPATKSCTTQTFAGGPGAAQPDGTFGRWQYFPSLGVFALVNDWQQDAWTLRMTP